MSNKKRPEAGETWVDETGIEYLVLYVGETYLIYKTRGSERFFMVEDFTKNLQPKQKEITLGKEYHRKGSAESWVVDMITPEVVFVAMDPRSNELPLVFRVERSKFWDVFREAE